MCPISFKESGNSTFIRLAEKPSHPVRLMSRHDRVRKNMQSNRRYSDKGTEQTKKVEDLEKFNVWITFKFKKLLIHLGRRKGQRSHRGPLFTSVSFCTRFSRTHHEPE